MGLHIHGILPQQHQQFFAFFAFEELVVLSALVRGRNRLNEFDELGFECRRVGRRVREVFVLLQARYGITGGLDDNLVGLASESLQNRSRFAGMLSP